MAHRADELRLDRPRRSARPPAERRRGEHERRERRARRASRRERAADLRVELRVDIGPSTRFTIRPRRSMKNVVGVYATPYGVAVSPSGVEADRIRDAVLARERARRRRGCRACRSRRRRRRLAAQRCDAASQPRHLLLARAAVGRPEVDDDRLAAEATRATRRPAPLEPRQVEAPAPGRSCRARPPSRSPLSWCAEPPARARRRARARPRQRPTRAQRSRRRAPSGSRPSGRSAGIGPFDVRRDHPARADRRRTSRGTR